MTREAAIANQEQIVADGFNLDHWYRTDCEKCCGVFPKVMTLPTFSIEDCYLQCEVCGKKTKAYGSPYLARDAWNRHEYIEDTQMSIFEFL